MEVMYTDTYTVEYMDSVTLSSTKVSWNFFKNFYNKSFFFVSDEYQIIRKLFTVVVLIWYYVVN